MSQTEVTPRGWNPGNWVIDYWVPAGLVYIILSVLATVVLTGFGSTVTTTTMSKSLLANLFIGVITLGGASLMLIRSFTWAQYGYNVKKESTRPMFRMGEQDYTMYRKERTGRESKPLVPFIARDIRIKREEQRELGCIECSDEVDFMEGCYFVEERQIKRILYIPVKDEILDVEAYCSEHQPELFI